MAPQVLASPEHPTNPTLAPALPSRAENIWRRTSGAVWPPAAAHTAHTWPSESTCSSEGFSHSQGARRQGRGFLEDQTEMPWGCTPWVSLQTAPAGCSTAGGGGGSAPHPTAQRVCPQPTRGSPALGSGGVLTPMGGTVALSPKPCKRRAA